MTSRTEPTTAAGRALLAVSSHWNGQPDWRVQGDLPSAVLAIEREAAEQAVADAVERVRRLENLRTRVEHMGLCSQTHHEYVMMAARDIAAAGGGE